MILSRMGLLHLQRDTIFAVAYLMFGLLCGAILTIAVRTLSRNGWDRATFFVFASFLTSAYVVTSAHLMGYLDHVIALLAMAAAWCAMHRRYWTAGVAIGAAMLVHETVLVTGIPVLVMAIALRPGAPRGRALASALAPMILPFDRRRGDLPERAQPRAPDGAPRAAHAPSLGVQMGQRRHEHPRAGMADYQLPPALPRRGPRVSLADHQPGIHVLHRPHDDPAVAADRRRCRRGAAIGWRRRPRPSCFPLSLHLLAFDTAREWTLPLIVGLMCVWVASESGSGKAAWGAVTRGFVSAAGLAIVLFNVFRMRYPLLDYLTDAFDNRTRALLYAPFFVSAALFLWRKK